jgi:DNA segregation ATPase FtsK/SpoIIIE-like protein
MTWEILLAASLEAGLGLLAEVGLGDEARDLKTRWLQTDERRRQTAFDRAFARARAAAGEESLRPLLDHVPFQEAVIGALLDPLQGLDLQAAAAVWAERLPEHVIALRRFFRALENTLVTDEVWGPPLERYQGLRDRQDVQQALQARKLDLSGRELVRRANVVLSGAIAPGQGAVAATAGGVAVGRDLQRSNVSTGDGNIQAIGHIVTIVHNASGKRSQEEDRAAVARYLDWVCAANGKVVLSGILRGGQQAIELPLDQVYVPLAAEAARPALDVLRDRLSRRETAERQGRRPEPELAEEMDRARQITMKDLLSQGKHLAVIGAPGCGKTTVLQHIAWTLAAALRAGDGELAQQRLGLSGELPLPHLCPPQLLCRSPPPPGERS